MFFIQITGNHPAILLRLFFWCLYAHSHSYFIYTSPSISITSVHIQPLIPIKWLNVHQTTTSDYIKLHYSVAVSKDITTGVQKELYRLGSCKCGCKSAPFRDGKWEMCYSALQPNGTEGFVVWFIVIIRPHFSLIHYMVVPVLHHKNSLWESRWLQNLSCSL